MNLVFLALIPLLAQAEPGSALGGKLQRAYVSSPCAKRAAEANKISPEDAGKSWREVVEFMPGKSDEEKVFQALEEVNSSSLLVEVECLPPLTQIAPHERWLELVKGRAGDSLKGKESAAMNRLLSELIRLLAAEKGPEAEKLREEYRAVLRPLFAEFQVRSSMIRIFRYFSADAGLEALSLRYGSALGDEKALSRAEEAIDDFLNGRNSDDPDGFHQAVLAVEAFVSTNPAAVASRQALLKRVSEAKAAPAGTKAVADQALGASKAE